MSSKITREAKVIKANVKYILSTLCEDGDPPLSKREMRDFFERTNEFCTMVINSDDSETNQIGELK